MSLKCMGMKMMLITEVIIRIYLNNGVQEDI